MKTRISKAVLGISPSATEATSFLANKLKREGIDVISFAQGEPDFCTPDNISLEAVNAVNQGYTRYTDVPGIPEVRQAVADKFRRENGIDYKPSEVMVSNGGKQALYLLFQTICESGDEVLIPTPCYVSYEEQVKLAGATAVFSPTSESNNFRLTVGDLIPFITPRTKAIIINTPNNPSGAVCSGQDLKAIADLAVSKGIYVITDEVYEHLVYDGKKHISMASFNKDIKELSITINSASKSYAMTGWRIGYAGGPEDVIAGMSKLQGHVSGNVNSITQKALIEALNGSQNAVGEMCKAYTSRRRLMVEKINQISGLSCQDPDGAFYVFTNIKQLLGRNWDEGVLESDLDVATFFLKVAHVAVVPGSAFRYPGYVRLVFAKSEEEISEGLQRIEKAIITCLK
jgi:aspartate aminotransferase